MCRAVREGGGNGMDDQNTRERIYHDARAAFRTKEVSAARTVRPINDGWLYSPEYRDGLESGAADETGFAPVRLPHTNRELAYNNFDERDYQFVSCYRRHLYYSEPPDGCVFLRFEGVMAAARVYFNGEFLCEHLGGYTPFFCELTGKIRAGDNALAVVVDSRERADIPPFGYVVDYLTYGGVYREVWLEQTGAVFADKLRVKTRRSGEGWRVEADVVIDNAAGVRRDARMRFTLAGTDGVAARFEQPLTLTGEARQQASAAFGAENVAIWDLNAPNLYTLGLELICGNDLLDETAVRFGFREARFAPEGFYLNGEKIKLRGLNRHQSFPYVGNAMPKTAQARDAELLRYDLGLNFVRTSHYPQSRHFLDRCDEIGLMVFEELPGWQHIGDETWKQNALRALEEMIERDWNHPSIVLWGTRINESQDDDGFYAATNALARRLDGTRQTGGVRNFEGSRLLEDVYTYNDFVHSGRNEPLKKPGEVTKSRAPYLVTEHNGHMFPTKKFDCEQKRVEHALRHLRVLERAYGTPGISGAAGWCMCDYNTHKDFGSGDRICYHGVMDMFRLPKEAAAAYRSQQDEIPVMEVASAMSPGERAGSMLERVYVFTNCDSVRLYRNGEYVGAYFPDRAAFPNLPHPPVAIADFIGDRLARNEGLNKRDAERVKRIFSAVARYGDKSLPLRYKLSMAYAMLKHRLPYQNAVDLFTRYVAGWGTESTEYTFEGYIGDRLVARAKRGPAASAGLRVTPDSRLLIEGDTYDVCRVVLEHVDTLGNVMPFSNEAVRIGVSGAGRLIGPDALALAGGSAAFWIRSEGAGEIRVTLDSPRFGAQELRLEAVLAAGE
ncbi:MAG: Beta-galactosidase [Firmicutes bacterium ADurb.Bin248]|nr:MAG: Beta-galactosidase [Firmicutes bacterium ADurb.Bin248]